MEGDEQHWCSALLLAQATLWPPPEAGHPWVPAHLSLLAAGNKRWQLSLPCPDLTAALPLSDGELVGAISAQKDTVACG